VRKGHAAATGSHIRGQSGEQNWTCRRAGACIFGLRHGCGYALANAGHDTRPLQAWLGHKNIQHTELTPDRLKDFWRCRGALPLIGARLPSWN
jgi:integrase